MRSDVGGLRDVFLVLRAEDDSPVGQLGHFRFELWRREVASPRGK